MSGKSTSILRIKNTQRKHHVTKPRGAKMFKVNFETRFPQKTKRIPKQTSKKQGYYN